MCGVTEAIFNAFILSGWTQAAINLYSSLINKKKAALHVVLYEVVTESAHRNYNVRVEQIKMFASWNSSWESMTEVC